MSLSVWLCAAAATGQGIAFESISWQQALDKARQENKWVFVDAYTTWCGPCKTMAARTFPDSAVGAFFRARFVSIQVDMEVGEGPKLAERYQVSLYPTSLFILPDGVLAHRAVGYLSPKPFLEVARAATDTAANMLALCTRYERGEHDPALLLALARTYSAAYDRRTTQVANEYFATQTDLNSPDNQAAIMDFADDPYAPAFRHFVQNLPLFESRFGTEQVAQKQDAVFETYLEEHPDLQLGEVQHLYATCYPQQGARLASNYRLSYHQEREEWAAFVQAAQEHVRYYAAQNPDELQEIAALFAQHISDPAQLEIAIAWAKQSVALQECAANQHTLALLFQKTGKKKAALKAARRALDLARQGGEDLAPIQQLIQELGG